MSQKRRDHKGKVLRSGESQRSDGQYMFRYTDNAGVRYAAYSWRLVASDSVPEDKRTVTALREMERQIQKTWRMVLRATGLLQRRLTACSSNLWKSAQT